MKFAKFVMFGALGAIAVGAILLTAAGVAMQIPAPQKEITNRRPFADYIGREYRVGGNVSALAWNDFPHKDTIVSMSLMSPPLVRNRFVSYSIPLKFGPRIRIISAWRNVTLSGFTYEYRVGLAGSVLSERIPITMDVNADGVPDPRVYTRVEE